MPKAIKKLVLASQSPRRRDLLSGLGFTFTVHSPDVDETVSGKPEDMVKELSERKARAVAVNENNALIIAADTLVAFEGLALGKPEDEEDAVRMLTTLSGNTHSVYTGVCIMDSESMEYVSFVTKSGVRFRNISKEEIKAYVQTGEPMDKAGAYAIQGGAGKFVDNVIGSYNNIVGFPTEDFIQAYKRFTGALK